MLTHAPDPRVEPTDRDTCSRGLSRPESPKDHLMGQSESVGSDRVGSSRVGSGRVRSGGFQSPWIGSGRVRRFSNLADRIGSGQELFETLRVGSVRVRSKHLKSLADPIRPTQPMRFDPAREEPCILQFRPVQLYYCKYDSISNALSPTQVRSRRRQIFATPQMVCSSLAPHRNMHTCRSERCQRGEKYPV